MNKTDHDRQAGEARVRQLCRSRPWYASVRNLLAKHGLRERRCLDLCAGACEFSELLRDEFAMQVTCADYVDAQLARARSLGFEPLAINFDWAEDRLDEVAAAHAGRFDLVVSLATLEHVFDVDSFLAFCHRVLRPGGQLAVNTPNMGFIGARLYSLWNGGIPYGEGHHVRFFDFAALRLSLWMNGFRLADDFRGYYGPPLFILDRCFKHAWAIRLGLRLFAACRLLQYGPLGRAWFTDELTVLATRDDAPPVGSTPAALDRSLPRLDGAAAAAVAQRLKAARRSGWLDRRPLLRGRVDAL